MHSTALLLSVRPKYAELFFSGRKRAELRRVRPNVKKGDLVLLYVSSPTKALMGAFQVKEVIQGTPLYLWRKTGNHSGITKAEFEAYYSGLSSGFAIVASRVWKLERPIRLSRLKQRWVRFTPPQSYRYIKIKDKRWLTVPVDKQRLWTLSRLSADTQSQSYRRNGTSRDLRRTVDTRRATSRPSA